MVNNSLFLLQRQKGQQITSRAMQPSKKTVTTPTSKVFGREFLLYQQTGKARKKAYDAAVAGAEAENLRLQQESEAQYQEDLALYNAALKKQQEEQAAYDSEQAAAEKKYKEDLAAYDAQVKAQQDQEAKYEADLKTYNEQKAKYDADVLAAQTEYDTELKKYNEDLDKYNKDVAAYEKQKKEYDDSMKAYETELAEYNRNKAEYDDWERAKNLIFKGKSFAAVGDTSTEGKITSTWYKVQYLQDHGYLSASAMMQGYQSQQQPTKPTYTFTDSLGQPMSIDPEKIGYQGMTTKEGVVFLKPTEPTKSSLNFDYLAPTSPALKSLLEPQKTVLTKSIEPFTLTSPTMKALTPVSAPTTPTFAGYDVLKPVMPMPKNPEAKYVDVLGQGVSYDPLKASLGTVTAYTPTEPKKFYQQDFKLKLEAMNSQIAKNKQKPLLVYGPAPTLKEQYSLFTKKQGVVEGTLSFFGSKLSEANTRLEQTLMRKVPGYQATQTEATASLFQLAPQAVKLTPAGPAIFLASGAESFGTTSGRQRLKEEQQAKLSSGSSLFTSYVTTYSKPVLDIGLGVAGLAGQRAALASARTAKLFEEAPTIIQPSSYRVVSGSKGYDVIEATKIIKPTNIIDKALGVKPTTYRTKIVQPFYEIETTARPVTVLEGGEGITLKITPSKPVEFTRFESGGRMTALETTPKAVYKSGFKREFEAEVSAGKIYTKPTATGKAYIAVEPFSTKTNLDIFYNTIPNSNSVYEPVIGVSKQLGNDEILLIGGKATKARLSEEGISVLGKPESYGKLKIITRDLEPAESVKFIKMGGGTKTPLSKTFGEQATATITKQSTASTGYLKSLSEAGMKPLAPTIKTTTVLEQAPGSLRSIYYGTGTYERFQPSENIYKVPNLISSAKSNTSLGTENMFQGISSTNTFGKLNSTGRFNDLGVADTRFSMTLKEPTKPEFKTRTSTELLSKPLEVEKVKQTPLTKPVERFREKFTFREIQGPTVKEIQSQKPRLKSQELFRPSTKQPNVTLTRIIANRIITPRTPSTPITPFAKPGSIKSSAVRESLISAYKTFIMRKGKKEYLSGISSKGEAVKRGETFARRTLAATFGVEKTNQLLKGKPVFDYKPSEESFRSYRIQQGKKVALKDTWIQKASKRLSAKTEVSEIQSTKRRKKKFSLF